MSETWDNHAARRRGVSHASMGTPLRVDIPSVTLGLEIGEDGIWYSREAIHVSYPEQGNEWCFGVEDESYWFEYRNRFIAALLRVFPPAGPLVDVGGGNGFVASMIQGAGLDVVVVEPGPEGARNAKKRGVANVICSSLEGAGFRNNTLPAAGLFDVIEHMEDDEDFLGTLSRLLIPGGRIYISAPAYKALWSMDDSSAGHFRRYTIGALRRKLEHTGYSIEFATYIFSFLPIPIFLIRTMPWRLGLRKSVVLEDDRPKHRLPAGLPGTILAGLLDMELRLLLRRRVVPFGGSCLLVAQRGPDNSQGHAGAKSAASIR